MATHTIQTARSLPMTTPVAGAAPLPCSAWAIWLCVFASAGLLYLCYFPVSVGALAWVALVPLLVLVRLPGRPRFLYLSCYLAATAFDLAALQWVRLADWMMYFSWVLLATYGALYWPVALGVLRWLDRRTRMPLVVTLPAVWVTLEYVRYGMAGCFVSLISGTHQHDVPGGFGWYQLGHTQHDFLQVIQIADLTGAYGVTALVAAVNALLFETGYARGWFRRVLFCSAPERMGKTALLINGVTVAVLLLLALAYGVWRMSEPLTEGPRIALIQTNVEQGRRIAAGNRADEERGGEARRSIYEEFRWLAEHARRQSPELIVTPETSYPYHWVEQQPGKPWKTCQENADRVADHVKTPILIGASVDVWEEEDGKGRSYNSSILLGPDGRWLGRYDKIHRVPFGEYVPMKRQLPFMKTFAPYDYDYEVAPGREFTRFPLSTATESYTFGVMICYEDTDPAMSRPYGGGGEAQTDFLLNVSNDGWFKGSSEHDQHLAISRFRAVECRRSVGRSVNVGISALIDPNGRVLAPELIDEAEGIRVWKIPEDAKSLPTSRWHEYKRVSGVIVGQVPIDTRTSVYARFGDWFAMGCLGFVSLWCVGLFVVRKRV